MAIIHQVKVTQWSYGIIIIGWSIDSCIHLPLGVEDGTIHSDQLTASSEYNDDLRPDRGRLNTVPDGGGSGAWVAIYNDQNQWIQADLSAVKGVIGVITQGRSQSNQWVTQYKVDYSTDGNNFEAVLGSSGQVETFSANTDANTEVTNIFNSVVYAKFIRIRPTRWNKHISLRFELLGAAPLDITLYSSTPLTSSNREFRGYVIHDFKTKDVTIGILYKDGNGKNNITWADTGHSGNITVNTGEQSEDMPDNKIFDDSSQIAYRVHNHFVYLGVRNLPNSERVGVFSFKATKSAMVSRSAIVLTSSSSNIVMQFRTLTVGIGESVTINLSKDGGYKNLSWRHYYGDAIQMWNGKSSVKIANIRAKDDGVYECYRDDSPDKNRGVIRLIVRGCPLPKWNPPECEIDCPVCYNGGVCDDKTGLCICPAGFKGDNCETGCGSNNWGRNCDVVCSSSGQNTDEACSGELFCPPDPVGCGCIDGYEGNDCNRVCDSSHYGADCRQVCHCGSGRCDSKTGNCTSGSTCSLNYSGPACQELLPSLPCPSDFFGVLCNYPCHCKDSADCNRNGSCDNGCHEAWTGTDCSIALPYSSKPPTLLNQTATTLKIAACSSWDPVQDFGTGPTTGCTLWYRTSPTSTFTKVNNTETGLYTIDNLLPHTTVEFYTRHSRPVGGEDTNGPPSGHGSAETICTKPLEVPEIKLKTVDDNEIILALKPVSNAPERIQCDDVLRYQVRYRSTNGNEQDIVNTTDVGMQTEVKISKLSPGCVTYDVDSRVVNNEEIVGDWGEHIVVQTAPSVPLITEDSVLKETSLSMKWNATTCNTQDQVMYHYQLSGGIDLQGSTKETEFLFNEGIVPCTQYTFTVLASHMNVSGTADTEEATSAVDYPGKPIITSLTSTSSSIKMKWTPSDDNPCTILEYNVLVYSDLTNFNIIVADTSLSITEGIMPNTNYSVKVAAMTHKGYGKFSDLERVSTNKDTPSTDGINGGVIGGLTGGLSVVIFAIVFIFVKRYKKPKTNHTTAKRRNVLDTPVYYVNESNKMSQVDEATYETPKPTEQDSYEQLPACDSSTEKALDGTYENLPHSGPEKVDAAYQNTHHMRSKLNMVTSLSKPKKTNHTITKVNTPSNHGNESNAMSKADESAYETPITTEQNSYEQLNYKQSACKTSNTEKSLDNNEPKKTNHTITKVNTPINHGNESNAMSQVDESAYETPIPTEQNSYEQLNYKQSACKTSNTEKSLDNKKSKKTKHTVTKGSNVNTPTYVNLE